MVKDLFAVLKKTKSTSIIVHNHPDPDALASAAGLRFILRQKGYKNVRIHYDGLVGRAENQEILKVLKVTLYLTMNITSPKNHQYIFVDCQPFTGNVTFLEGLVPVGVIDHHPMKKTTLKIPFHDVRPHYGACSTIIYEYLTSLNISIPTNIITALCYAISSETQYLDREGSHADKKAFLELLTQSNLSQLSKIQYPKLPREFIANLSRALLNTFYYKKLIGVILEELPYPDFVAQMADFLLRIKNMTWSICLGSYKRVLYVSLRTSNTRGNAAKVIQKIIPKQGRGGGHEMIAGAQVKIEKKDSYKIRSIKNEIVVNILRELHYKDVPYLFKLVSKEKFPLY